MSIVKGSGMSREEILKHSDTMQKQILEYVSGRPKTTTGNVEKDFKISRDQARCYLRNLTNRGFLNVIGARYQAYYVATGKPYEDKYDFSDQKPKATLPNARLITFDRKQVVTPYLERRKQQSSSGRMNAYTGSTMSLFETF